MIAVLRFSDSFEHSQMPILNNNCREFVENFPANRCEFFDALYATRPERFLIIRVDTKDRENFVRAVESFGAAMEFEVLKRADAEAVLKVNDLDKFV